MSEQSASESWVVNTTDESFEVDVFTRSLSGLVVVDFWAEWCAPCRMLGPVLEKLAQEFAGRFTLVKADTEQSQQAAGQFQVTGIPAVYAVLDGEIIDSFQGAMPEESIRGWLDGLFRKSALSEARRMSESSPEVAEAHLREVMAESPNEAAPALALLELMMQQERDEECRELLAKLEERGFLEPAAEKAKAALELKSKGNLDLAALRAAAEAAPQDWERQFALAEALAGAGEYQAAFEICLQLVSQDRKQTGEKARELMVGVFRVLPDDSELTSEYRRKLSMVLY